MKLPKGMKDMLFDRGQQPRKPDSAADTTPDPKPEPAPEPIQPGGGEEQEAVPDGREIAAENEFFILRAIHRLGHATSWQISYMSGLNRRSVQRVIKRLSQQNMLASAKLPNGEPVYLLRQAGADELSLNWQRKVKRTNDDYGFIRSRLWKHRKLANDAAAALSQNFQVYTEREIQTGRNPARRREILPGKVPDLLYLDHLESGNGWVWVEIERAYKKRSNYKHLIKTAEMIAMPREGARPMLGRKPILYFALLAEDLDEAKRHVRRFMRQYNVKKDEPLQEHLGRYLESVYVIYWSDGAVNPRNIVWFFRDHC